MLVNSLFSTPIGGLIVTHDEHYLIRCQISSTPIKPYLASELAVEIKQQLDNYFSNPSFRFNLSYKLQGTPFQQKVWNALIFIPNGQTKTYGEMANQLNTSPRAIGQACKTNPLPLFIPCHRVIGQNNMGGYMGKKAAINIKQSLLNHEVIAL